MPRSSCFVLLSLAVLFSACGTPKPATGRRTGFLNATALQPFGRTRITTKKELELISSAVHFGVRFSGAACTIYASLPAGMDHNYLQYELDGVYQKRLRVSGVGTQPIVISAAGTGTHTLVIYKATEAQTGPILIQKLEAPGIQSLAPATAPLIEFIGNSITCGAAADASEVPCGTGVYHDQHNAYMAYGPRVARSLGAHFLMSSVSGIGIYRNWNSDGPAMPDVYEKRSLNADDTAAWDFKKYTPQVVSIALGTNDFSKGDGKKVRLPFDSAQFVSRYIAFVNVVQRKYPAAQIALLSSPMLHDSARTQLQNCLAAVKNVMDAQYASSHPLVLFFFEPMQAHGCNGHPSVEDHAILAGELLPFFKKLLHQ